MVFFRKRLAQAECEGVHPSRGKRPQGFVARNDPQQGDCEKGKETPSEEKNARI